MERIAVESAATTARGQHKVTVTIEPVS